MARGTLALPFARSTAWRTDIRPVAAWLLGCVPAAYLGLVGGGYDVIVRSQVGIALWWLVLLGVLVGALCVGLLSRAGLLLGSVFAAFAVWAIASTFWAESPERALSEAARDVTLLGLFVLVASGVRSVHVRHLLGGLVSAIALVAVVAALSRLHPSWFGPSETGEIFANVRERLSYPLNYWNALGAFMAMGVPLALGLAQSARTPLTRAACCGVIPLLVLVLALTLSRGAIAASAVGCFSLLSVSRRRLQMLALAVVPAAGSSILVAAAWQRDEIRRGLTDQVALRQGDEMLAVLVVVVAGTGLLVAGLAYLSRSASLPGSWATRIDRITRSRVPTLMAFAIPGLIGAVGAAQIDWQARWASFTDPSTVNSGADRLASGGGNGRWQLWEQAWGAFTSSPLHGIGGGGFDTWWPRHATIAGQVRNAHNLYVETLGDLGAIGGLLLLMVVVLVLAIGAIASRRADAGGALAGGVGASAAFFAASAVDWDWQVTALPAAVFVIAAAGAAALGDEKGPLLAFPRASVAATAGVSLAAIGITLIPLAGASAQRRSQEAAARDAVKPALRNASDAAAVQPYASTPLLQRALILETQGDFDQAAVAARRATAKAPLDWRTHLTLARIEAERGNIDGALSEYKKVRELNPKAKFLR